jgi:homoserine dehydrogenase
MERIATWGLIGFGNIGHEVLRQIKQPGVAKRLGLEIDPGFIIDSGGIMEADGHTPAVYKRLDELPALPDVIFVAIPSSDDGKIAYGYIAPLLKQGKLVVTAEKGALANNFAKLRSLSDNFRLFGTTATVGGGTRLLRVVREYCQDIDNITQIHLALNGTLAAMMDWVAPMTGSGVSLTKAAERAIAQKYAEPGSDSPAAIIRAEAEGDIPKKLAIFYNSVGLGSQLIDWHNLRFSLTDEQIQKATASPIPRRFIVSLYSPSYLRDHPEGSEDDIIGGFMVAHDGWQMVGGFRQVDASPLFGSLAALTGPGNGIVIGLGPRASDGVYAVTGPGAGVNPTVNTMLDDFVRLKSLQRTGA